MRQEGKLRETPKAKEKQKLIKGQNISEPYLVQPDEYVSLTKQIIIGWQMRET